MSYDLTIWCAAAFDDPTLLPSPDKWTVSEGDWSYESKAWVINTGPSDHAFEEDIPEDVVGLVPGIAYVVSVSLEPLGAPKTALAMLRRIAKTVAMEAHGVVVNPQESSFELPRGSKRYVSPKRDKGERFALLEMSWWMTHDGLLDEARIDALIRLLEGYLPEALPRRYGLYEPPQHVYAGTGRDHLVSFLTANLTDSVVWYSTRPVGHWSFSIDRECGWQRLGQRHQYRCNRISITFDAAALQQPGWPIGLRRFWEKVSRLVQPFFGDRHITPPFACG